MEQIVLYQLKVIILNLNKNNLQKFGNVLLEKLYNFNNDNKSKCFLKHLSIEDNQIKDIKLELTNLLTIATSKENFCNH